MLGREAPGSLDLGDPTLSRRQTEVTYDGERWSLRDLGSKNGTFVDGVRIATPVSVGHFAVVRVGLTLFIVIDDVTPYLGLSDLRVGPLILGC